MSNDRTRWGRSAEDLDVVVARALAWAILWWTLSAMPVVAGGPSGKLSIEDALAMELEDLMTVSIATGAPQALDQAPAIATVITADDIRAMGATDLEHVLESVPGLHVSRTHLAYNPLFVMRGLWSETAPYVLFLVNGHPMTLWESGNVGDLWGGMPVEAIARIEVLRGPGSALFGADAVGGVVNIVTKTAADIDGGEGGVRGGSFETAAAWWLYGGHHGGVDVALALQAWTTDGQRELIEVDTQTALDNVFGTSASLAPGPVSAGGEGLEANLDLAKDEWRLRLGIQRRDDLGSGGGFLQALDPFGSSDRRRTFVDLTWQRQELGPKWDLDVRLGALQNNGRIRTFIFPPGVFNGAALFPEGQAISLRTKQSQWHVGVTATYRASDQHRWRLGIGGANIEYDDIESRRGDDIFGRPLPGGFQDVTDDPDLIFGIGQSRDLGFIFVQDEWRLGDAWEITAGVRWDRYSDFGDTVNPRLAVVWNASERLTAKFLYGHAFRPPSYRELYLINNPELIGNPELEPEVMKTVELGLSYRGGTGDRLSLNLFSYRLEDLILLAGQGPMIYSNVGERRGEGLEIEGRWTFGAVEVTGNYAYQRATEEPAGADVPHAPGHQLYVRADWRLDDRWRLGGIVSVVADRHRAAGDLRQAIDDDVTFDLVLRRERLSRRFDLAILARNLFDEDVREPSLFVPGFLPRFIPGDLPQAGRSILAELRFKM